MTLDRRELRDDLAAAIAAGRELPPEHDYALADVFIERARENLRRELSAPAPPAKRRGIGPLVAAVCLGLAALTVPFVAIHAGHPRASYVQPSQQVIPIAVARPVHPFRGYPDRVLQVIPGPHGPTPRQAQP